MARYTTYSVQVVLVQYCSSLFQKKNGDCLNCVFSVMRSTSVGLIKKTLSTTRTVQAVIQSPGRWRGTPQLWNQPVRVHPGVPRGEHVGRALGADSAVSQS